MINSHVCLTGSNALRYPIKIWTMGKRIRRYQMGGIVKSEDRQRHGQQNDKAGV